MTSNQQLLPHILDAPFLDSLSRADLARLTPNIELVTPEDGKSVFAEGDDAQTLFLILDGEVTLDSSSQHQQINNGYFGEELLLDDTEYRSSAIAVGEDCRLLAFRGAMVKHMLADDPLIFKRFLKSYLSRQSGEELPAPQLAKPVKSADPGWFKLLGWVLVWLVPLSIYAWTADMGMTENARTFVSIFIVSIFMWAFKLVPDYVAGMLSILVVLVLGIVPSEVVLSGFRSSSFFMAMSIFVLAVIIVDSGLIYRFSLFLLKVTPCSTFAYNLMLTLIGLLFTPVLPSANGRIGLVTPLLKDLVASLKFEHGKRDANRMALSAFFGASLFSSIFLTSKAINFLVFSMLPTQVQDNFQWSNWTEASMAAGLVMLVLFLLFSHVFFRSKSHPQIDKSKIHMQLKVLGKLSFNEWGALLGITLMVLGIVTTSIHKIKPAWIGMAIMLIFLALGTMSKASFKKKIDWPFLFLLGTLIGLTKTVSYLGLDKMLALQLGGLQTMMSENFHLFVLVLFGVILLIRFALSTIATIVIVSSVFLPLAATAGVNMWVVGFIILTLSEAFMLPYQCSYYVLFKNSCGEDPVYREKSFLRFNLWVCVFRLTAIYVSIPIWQAMEIL
mgnify:CR=1 FL=1|jgi:DASS family divalent anion:Na+ symporter